MRKLVMYCEDIAPADKFVDRIDQDPQWELVAVCRTRSDLLFVLDRIPVDIVLMEVTALTGEDFIAAVCSHLRGAALVLCVPPEPLALEQGRPHYPSAQDILGVQAYTLHNGLNARCCDTVG